ncbi:PspC domain-containing protein [Dietzia sp.]|uniref:PspC domain-containing protein n=1 Tax=Dietzia sp. TaxID=1871616 RepID=UPI002FD89D53
MTTTQPQEPDSRTARDFSDQIKDLWATRPVRPAGSKKLAGVASAIGHRYDIDPTLVRVVFVVSALMGGAGIALYLACAVLFKYQDNQLRVHETMFHRREEHKSLFLPIVLSILFLFCGPWNSIGGSGIDAATWVVSAVLLVGLYALYRSRPEPPSYMLWAYSTGPRSSMPPASPAYMMTKQQMQQWERQGRPGRPADYGAGAHRGTMPEQRYDDGVTPPAWDPLGAARFAWDLPDPPDPTVRAEEGKGKKRGGAALTWITLGIAAAAGVIAGFFVGRHPVFTGLAVALVVVGAGMMLGSFRKHGLGLLPIALLLGASLVATGLGDNINVDEIRGFSQNDGRLPSGASEGFVGESSAVTANPAQIDQGINAAGSDLTVRFDELEATDYKTELNAVASSVTISPSSDHNIAIHCDGTAMSSCESKTYPATGPGNSDDKPTIEVAVNLFASEVKVQ